MGSTVYRAKDRGIICLSFETVSICSGIIGVYLANKKKEVPSFLKKTQQ
jgi:hypothetical protein